MRLPHLIDQAVGLHGDRAAVVCGQTTRTFAEVGDRARRLGAALLALGLEPGDRVAVLLPNCAECLEVDLGLARAGLVRASLNVRAPARQQAELIEDCEPRALIYATELGDVAAGLAGAPGLERLVRLGEDDGSDATDYEPLLAAAVPGPAPVMPEGGDALYCLFYTSGTTGRPKGVMLSHRAYVAVAVNLLLEFGPVRPGERIVLTQPLSHGGGFFMLPWFLSGATCIVMPRFEAGACLELCARHEAETLKVVPTMLLQMLEAGLGGDGLRALRKIIYGASPMPAEQLGDLIERFGPIFAQLYGQAEAPMSITVLTEEDHREGGRLLSSAGRPWRGVEVRVVDEEGRDVPPGEPGEILVAGPHLTTGYWRRPEQTAKVLRGGYLHTRDTAERDERGYLYLLGRTDEMIISGGFNVAPRVVEGALNRHPGVLESFVIGLPHDTLGQQVAAFVAPRPGAELETGALADFARAELGYQKPRQLFIVPRLPRNAYGKVVTADLRELATTEPA
jgi:acyl-CoA synthetase (AMP-forming)/AMP-acid ligase II